jgi:hypothetical protein
MPTTPPTSFAPADAIPSAAPQVSGSTASRGTASPVAAGAIIRTGLMITPFTATLANAQAALVANARYFLPILAPRVLLTSLNALVVIAGAAGTLVRLGLYAHDDILGGPGALLADSGDLAGDVAAQIGGPISPVAPSDDWRWLMVQANASVTLRGGSTTVPASAILGGQSPTAQVTSLLQVGMPYGAAPSPAPAILTDSTARPIIWATGTRV